eukprot:m.207704 g.207704  ORF g.207704 m.207704 type:complete len:632 (-) comp32990_c0_seq1:484-2379(-)
MAQHGANLMVACLLTASIVFILSLIFVLRRRTTRQLSRCAVSIKFVKHVRDVFEKHESVHRPGFIVDESVIRECLLALDFRVSPVMVTDLMRKYRGQKEKAVELGDFLMFSRLIWDFRESTAWKLQATLAKRNRNNLNLNHIDTPAHRTRNRSQYQVFLGGSCNPTTWRVDLAIPILQQSGITYYNPQVDFWEPALVELEQQAKKNAQLLFFVIDNRTRGIASMVEVAHLAASNTQLVVVMQDFGEECIIDGTTMSPSERMDLNRGHDFLCYLLHQNGIPLFDDVTTAMQYVTRLVKSGESIFDVKDEPYVFEPVIRGVDVTMLNSTNAIMRQYDERRSGSLSIRETHLALKSLLDISLTEDEIRSFVQQLGGSEAVNVISKNDFCSIVAALLPISHENSNESLLVSTMSMLLSFLPTQLTTQLTPWATSSGPVSQIPQYDIARDVFLGGGCGPLQQWRERDVIPLLRKTGLDYFNPNVDNWTPQLIPLEAQAKQQCSVLFFYIGADTRAIGTMVEAAHFIGRGRTVVICMADVKPSSVIHNLELGKLSAKDLNRGRLYLADIANRQGLKQFSNLDEAAHELVDLIQQRKNTANRMTGGHEHRWTQLRRPSLSSVDATVKSNRQRASRGST